MAFQYEIKKTSTGYICDDITWEYGLKHKIHFAKTKTKKEMATTLKKWGVSDSKVKNIDLIK